MESITIFHDVSKFVDFWRKYADISRTQRVYHTEV